jgi:ABC-type amino acid transport system permease subunit
MLRWCGNAYSCGWIDIQTITVIEDDWRTMWSPVMVTVLEDIAKLIAGLFGATIIACVMDTMARITPAPNKTPVQVNRGTSMHVTVHIYNDWYAWGMARIAAGRRHVESDVACIASPSVAPRPPP